MYLSTAKASIIVLAGERLIVRLLLIEILEIKNTWQERRERWLSRQGQGVG